jgi:hypothetical protein
MLDIGILQLNNSMRKSAEKPRQVRRARCTEIDRCGGAGGAAAADQVDSGDGA